MKLLKTLTVASLLAAATLSAHAQSLVHSWTDAGGAWLKVNQPNFTNGTFMGPPGGGYLLSDQSLAQSSSGGKMDITGVTSGGLQDTYYYTLFSKPTFTATITDILPGTNKIEFSIIAGVSLEAFTMEDLSYSFGDYVTGFSYQEVFVRTESSSQGDADIYNRVWSWDVENLGSSPISFEWHFGNEEHLPLYEVVAVQSIPEPSTYALLGAGLIFSAIAYRRRRMATAA